MTLPATLQSLAPADWAALAAFLAAALGTGWLIEHPPAARPSVTVLMAAYRRDWMREFVTRTPRIFDAAIIDSLRQGTAFLASASLIALGGGLALIGNARPLETVAAELSLPGAGGALAELKLVLVLLCLANALLKFVWANRLFAYCAVLMAAVPNDPAHPEAYRVAGKAAGINITAARGFNRGLRSVYLALAATAWLAGPYALMAATAATVAVMLRREFFSSSRAAIVG
jgi:uncharacterized membrane protein